MSDNAFPSLSALREAHVALLQQRSAGETPELIAAARQLVARGVATGALLDDDPSRRTAQSLLDYWSNLIFRADPDAGPPDATIAPFDPSLAPTLDDALCPYVGLDAFGEQDAGRFYGRQRLVAELIDSLRERRLVAVVGRSGSGKSSIVRAGLLPALRAGALPGSEAWQVLGPIVPGSDPVVALGRALRRSPPGEAPTLLVVDQFEETFTLCRDPDRRALFVDRLVGMAQHPDRQDRVVLTMRSDFEEFVARLPELQPLFEAGRVQVTPLSAGELREAIEQPAAAIGLRFEAGVVDRLLQDTLGEPAALPLLQFTLFKLWEQREQNRITLDAYRRVGGGREALARSAEALYSTLSVENQTTARRILLRMVRPSEGLEVTSNRVLRADLLRLGEDRARVEEVLERLVRARLLRVTPGDTPDDAQVEVAHEALIRNWPRLVGWIDEERAVLRRRRQLTDDAARWETLGRDVGALLRGAALDEALAYGDLSDLERMFLEASLAERERDAREREAARQRELEQAQQLAAAERRRAEEQRVANQRLRRQQRWLVIATAMAALAAVVAGLLGYQAIGSAREAEEQRTIAQTEARRARAAQLVAYAGYNTTGLLLGVEALSRTLSFGDPPPPEAVAFLQEALPAFGGQSLSLEFGASGRRLLSPDASSVLLIQEERRTRLLLYDLTAPDARRSHLLEATDDTLRDVRFGADGRLLVALWERQGFVIWDLTQSPPARRELDGDEALGVAEPVESLESLPIALSADGGRLAVGLADQRLRLWNLAAAEPPIDVAVGEGQISAVAFSADDRRLAAGDSSGSLFVWDLADLSAPQRVESVEMAESAPGVLGLAFTPDGGTLAVSGFGSVRLLDLVAPDQPPVSLPTPADPEAPVTAPTFSADGFWLLVRFSNTMLLWDLRRPADGAEFVGDTAAFTPDSSWLATILQHEVRLLDLRRPLVDQTPVTWSSPDGDVLHQLTIAGDGQSFVTLSEHGRLRRWPVAPVDTSAPVQRLVPPGLAYIQALALTSDGRLLIAGGQGGATKGGTIDQLVAWDMTALQRGAVVLPGHTEPVVAVAASPVAGRFATADSLGRVLLWDAADLAEPLAVLQGPVGDPLLLRFSPDGRWLAALPTRSGAGTEPERAPHIWDLAGDLAAPAVYRLQDGGVPLLGLAFSPDSSQLATGAVQGGVRLWQLEPDGIGRPMRTLPMTGTQAVIDVAFSSDGRWLAAAPGQLNGTELSASREPQDVLRWDLSATRAEVERLSGHAGAVQAVLFLPDGRLVTAGVDGNVSIWPAAEEPADPPITLRVKGLQQLVLSPDGRWLATIDQSATVLVADMRQPRAGLFLVGGAAGPSLLAFGAGGDRLLVSDGLQVLVRPVAPELLREGACHAAGRNLTLDEWNQFFGEEPYHATCAQHPQHPTLAGELLVEAQEAAEAGDLARATQLYSDALAIDTTLWINPAGEARRVRANVLLLEAETRAWDDNLEATVDALRRALEVDPTVELDPLFEPVRGDVDALARRMLAKVWRDAGDEALGRGAYDEAFGAYTRARERDPALLESADGAIGVCVAGALAGSAGEVVADCERATAVVPQYGVFRAMGLAQQGDLQGAVADLRAVQPLLDTMDSPSQTSGDAFRWGQRIERWIAALEQGRDPFDEAELEELRQGEPTAR